jgi:hypothetical protein
MAISVCIHGGRPNVGEVLDGLSAIEGRLYRSTQHFNLEGKDRL